MSEVQRIAVIGGGPAGCCAAWMLHESEVGVELFEKEQHLGGRTRTWRGSELTINTGAAFFTNFYPLMWELLSILGLSRQMVNNDKEIVLCDTHQSYRYQLASIASFFRIPWLTLREKLRVIRLTAGLLLRKTRYDLVDPKRLADFDHESIAEYARRKLGDNVYEHLIRPAVEPYWYFSCEDASAALLMALQAEAPGAQFYSLRGGMDQLASHLAKDVAKHSECEVLEIVRTSDGKFQVTTTSGIHETLFDGVIVATQAPQALQLVESLPLTDVTAEQRDFLSSQEYAANINVWYRLGETTAADCGFQLSPVGKEWHGIAAWTDLADVTPDSERSGDRVAGAYLLHDLSLQLLEEPDDVVAARAWHAVRQFNPQLPVHHPEVVRIHRRRNAIPIPAVGRYRLAAEFQNGQRPPVMFAGDYLATATIEGALQTGRIAADRFLDEVCFDQ